MRYIRGLTLETLKILKRIEKESKYYQVRRRALCIKSNDLESYTFACSINSEVVVACIDKFSEKIKKDTVLVMDNASVHQNQILWDKQIEWERKGLTIFFLPTYSPHLNKIEIPGAIYQI